MVSPSDVSGFLGKLSLNVWYKYLLYVFGVIYIVSIFVPVQNGFSSRVIDVSFWTIVLGVCLWFIEETIATYGRLREEFHNIGQSETEALVTAMYVIEAIGLFIWFIILIFS